MSRRLFVSSSKYLPFSPLAGAGGRAGRTMAHERQWHFYTLAHRSTIIPVIDMSDKTSPPLHPDPDCDTALREFMGTSVVWWPFTGP